MLQRKCASCEEEVQRQVVQRKCAMCPDEDKLQTKRRSPSGEASLQVSEPDDAYEHEADRIAEVVTEDGGTGDGTPEGVATFGPATGPGSPRAPSVSSASSTAIATVQRDKRQRGGGEEEEEESDDRETRDQPEQGMTESGGSDATGAGGGEPSDDGDVENEQDAALFGAGGPAPGGTATATGATGAAAPGSPNPAITDAEADAEVQCKPAAETPKQAARPDTVVDALRHGRGGGRPLPAETRAFMESRFGFDLGSVRVHADSDAARLTDDLDALAFTNGRHIYFAPGHFRPGTRSGDRLLAHELTHVVQQAGGAAGGPMAARPRLQAKLFPASPNTVHHEVQKRLRAVNQALMTEAPIPGGTRERVALDVVGYADFYEAEGNKVPNTRVKTSRTGVQTFDKLTPANKRKLEPKKIVNFSPTKKRNSWIGKFPTSFQVADLKALIFSTIGGGYIQIHNYTSGLAAFSSAFDKANPGSGTTSGSPLTTLTIPAGLDYSDFDNQLGKSGPGQYVVGDERLWVWDTKQGILVYFFIDKNYKSHQAADLKREQEDVVQVEALKQDLLQPGNQVGKLELVDKKARPGISAVRPRAGVLRRAAGRTLVQRNGAPAPKIDWKQRGEEWEKKRAAWATPARTWMRGKGREHVRKMKVDAKLGIAKPLALRPDVTQVQGFKSIRFWSSPFGKFVGKLRFFLGKAFDWVIEKFEAIKAKFQSWFGKAKTAADNGVGSGWKKRLIKIFFLAIKIGVKKFLQESFSIFADCANALVGKAVDTLIDEAKSAFKTELDRMRKAFCDFKDKLEEKFKEIFGVPYEDVINALTTAKQWLDLVTTLEGALRLGFQIVSCLEPPALGCLWGLIGQVAFDVILDLIVGTEWFQENVVKSLSVKELLKKFLGRQYQGVMDKVIDSIGLTGFAKGVKPCHIADTPFDLDSYMELSGGGPNTMHRSVWESKYGQLVLQELKGLITVGNGKEPTEEELKKLLEAVQAARKQGITDADIRALLDQSRQGGKRISLAQALTEFAKKGVAPGAPPPGPSPSDKGKAGPEATPAAPPPTGGGAQPAPSTEQVADKGGGGGGDKGTGEGGVPVVDASKLPTAARQPTDKDSDLSGRFIYSKTHTRDPGNPVKLSDFEVYDKKTKATVLYLTNVKVHIPSRQYYPTPGDEKSATHLKVFYRFAEGFVLPAPYDYVKFTPKEGATYDGFILVKYR